MLFLTNFFTIAGILTATTAYFFGVNALADWAGDKWEGKGFFAVLGVFVFLPLILLHTFVVTYGA